MMDDFTSEGSYPLPGSSVMLASPPKPPGLALQRSLRCEVWGAMQRAYSHCILVSILQRSVFGVGTGK